MLQDFHERRAHDGAGSMGSYVSDVLCLADAEAGADRQCGHARHLVEITGQVGWQSYVTTRDSRDRDGVNESARRVAKGLQALVRRCRRDELYQAEAF